MIKKKINPVTRLMKPVFYSIIIFPLLLTGCFPPTQEKSAVVKNDSAVYTLFNKHQILLTNWGEFNGHTSLYGASSFLVEYKNKIYAATAKHLIGEDGGVLPVIAPNELSDAIKNWKMYPRVPVDETTDTVIVGKEKLITINLTRTFYFCQ